jgi:hypothetical protein
MHTDISTELIQQYRPQPQGNQVQSSCSSEIIRIFRSPPDHARLAFTVQRLGIES